MTVETVEEDPSAQVDDHYRWVALANTTAAVFMSMLDGSIVIIALPAIFRGIHLDPLAPGNIVYLLWMIMGYRLVQAVTVVTFGRLGDMFGRVKIYNAGFVVFTVSSILLSVCPFMGVRGAQWLIGWRLVQALGGSMLTANSVAILTDAFPSRQRGFALGLNQVAALAGMFVGLVAGGLLAAVDWRLVFWVNVPVGVFGTLWAYWKLREISDRQGGRVDWWGNLTFAGGLGAILVGVTYGIQPYGRHAMGWTSPMVDALIVGGAALLGAFVVIETRVAEPLFQLSLFRIRAFTAGNIAGFAVSVARGGLQFVLIIWLQGIWLPLHGYSYSQTPLWAGHLPPPADGGLPGLGSAGRHPVGPFRFPGHGHRRDDGVRGQLRRAVAAPGGLPVLGLRAAHRRQRHRQRDVRRPQHVVHHEQRPGPFARRCLRHAGHVPELRDRALHRHLLLADDRRADRHAFDDPEQRAASARCGAERGPPRGLPAAGLLLVRRPPRRQPDSAPVGPQRRAVDALGVQPAPAHRSHILPPVDLRAVPPRTGRGLRLRRRPLCHCRAGLAAAGPARHRCPPRATRPARPDTRNEPDPMTDQIPPLEAPHTALLVMDYQAGIVTRVPEAEQLLERARAAIDLVRDWGGQVGYVRVAFDDDDLDFPESSRMGALVRDSGGALHADSPTTAIDERVAPAPGDVVVRKTRVGAFSTTDLHDQLQDLGVDTIVLAGISTSGVVLSTVIEAHDLDYRVLVLADGCADTDPEVHTFLLEKIFPRRAAVITLAELPALLSRG